MMIRSNKHWNCRLFLRYVLAAIVLAMMLPSIAVFSVSAQPEPLSLAEVLTALQSKSSGLTLIQKNSFISQRVDERRVTFRLTPEIETELRRAGASPALISMIRNRAPQAAPTPAPQSDGPKKDADFERTWIDYDVTRDGMVGMVVHSTFTTHNLKDESLFMSVRFMNEDDEFLTSTDKEYSNKAGQTAVYRLMKPGSSPAIYKDLSVFMPYKEFNIAPGKHILKADVDLIYPNGDLLKHLISYEFEYDNAEPSLSAKRVEFDKMWVDYDVTEEGIVGMRIHTSMTVYNMKDVSSYLFITFETQTGEKLFTSNTKYRASNGQVSVLRSLAPQYPATVYKDLTAFIPYGEFNLAKGIHNLRMHADLFGSDNKLISHLNYYNFRYTKK